MADQQTREETRKKLENIDPNELVRLLTKKVNKQQKEIEQKDALIAELSTTKSKTDQEAQRIIASAQEKADAIKAEAETHLAEAKRIEEEAEEAAAKRIADAKIEANSILDTTLNSVKKDITELENKRGNTKAEALAFLRNITAEYDTLIDETTQQVSAYKDIRTRLDDQIAAIDSEEFRRFNINDYVTTSPASVPATPTDGMLDIPAEPEDDDDVDFDTLRYLLEDDDDADDGDDDEESFSVADIIGDDFASFSFDVSEEDADLVNNAPEPVEAAMPIETISPEPTPVYVEQPTFDTSQPEPQVQETVDQQSIAPVLEIEDMDEDDEDGWSDFSFEDDLNSDEFAIMSDDNTTDIGDAPSLTATFMPAVVPETAPQEIEDMDDDDIDDFDFVSIDDWQTTAPEPSPVPSAAPMQNPAPVQQPQNDDLGFDEVASDFGNPGSPIQIPTRPQYQQGRQGQQGGSRWL